jgi:hypothetical protein
MNAVAKHEGGRVVAPVNDPDSFLRFIAEASRDGTVDLAKMDHLYEMRERMLARQAHLDFNAALKAAKKDMPRILRNKENKHTKSTYADLAAVSAAMDPVITQHGFSTSFGTADSPLPNHYRITCTLSHDGGHEKEYQADIPIDSAGPKGEQNKTLTHAFGSTMSYGRRYLKMMIFDVATVDDDGNGNASAPDGPVTAEALNEFTGLVDQHKADQAKLLAAVGCDSLTDITAKQLRDATAKLKAWASSKKGGGK